MKFTKFVKEEYAPRGRTEPGMWSLPDGAERYATTVKRQTTTKLTPDEIHKIGIEQVALIEKEMMDVAKKLGFADWKARAVGRGADKLLVTRRSADRRGGVASVRHQSG